MSATGDGATLILKEYLCYKLYQVITPYALKARLVNIDFTSKLKNDKQFKLRGIILEDGDKLAKRFDSKLQKMLRHLRMLYRTQPI